MGRGLFSGLMWGSLFAILSLWVVSQVGGVVGVLDASDTVQASASTAVEPEPAELETDSMAAAMADEPLQTDVETPSNEDVEQTEQPDVAAVETETVEPEQAETPVTPPVVISPAASSPTPAPTETVTATTQPDPETAPVAPDQTASNELRNTESGQPLAPNTDQPPVVATIAPVPQPTPAPVTVAQSPDQPPAQSEPQTEQQTVAVLEPEIAPVPEVAAGPGQPSNPAPGVKPGGDFSTPVVVPTPSVEPEQVEPDPSIAETTTPVIPGPEPVVPEATQQQPTQPDASDSETTVAEPETVVASVEPTPEPIPEVAAVPNDAVLDGDGQLESQGALENIATNVRTNRLPSIGNATEVPEINVAPVGEPQPDSTVATSGGSAIRQYAQAFTNSDDRPLMAILLLPDAAGDNDDSTALPFPVSYVVDASQDGANEKMQQFRDGGFEVAALMPLPKGANPQDVETAFQTYMGRVDQAVAVIDTTDAEFQSGRAVASQVAQVLAASGHGMITYSKGLNSAPQIAEREGVPAALVFRDFDSDGQDGAAIKRFLDQAAFRAGQQSGVILVGHNRPETVKALLEWSLGNRANTVALAPVSVVLLNQ